MAGSCPARSHLHAVPSISWRSSGDFWNVMRETILARPRKPVSCANEMGTMRLATVFADGSGISFGTVPARRRSVHINNKTEGPRHVRATRADSRNATDARSRLDTGAANRGAGSRQAAG